MAGPTSDLGEKLLQDKMPRSTRVALPLVAFCLGLACAFFISGWGGHSSAAENAAISMAVNSAPGMLSTMAAQPTQHVMPLRGEPVTATNSFTSRRGLLGASSLLTGTLLGGQAQALIPDDEDKALVAKAKANRKAQIQKEKRVERDNVKSTSKVLDAELFPVQVTIKQLAMAGSALQKKEDLKAAVQEFDDGKLGDFEKAITKVSTIDEASVLVKPLSKSVKDFRDYARDGKVPQAKKEFVSTVQTLNTWAKAADVETLLRGL